MLHAVLSRSAGIAPEAGGAADTGTSPWQCAWVFFTLCVAVDTALETWNTSLETTGGKVD